MLEHQRLESLPDDDGEAGEAPCVRPPILTGHLARLRPLLPSDHQALYTIAIEDETSMRWRFRGIVPHFDQFVQSLYHKDLLAQLVVSGIARTEAVGFVAAYGADPRSGFAYVATMMTQRLARQGIGAEATTIFMNYLFQNWPFRKLYMEVVEYNLSQFSSVARLAREEGRLTQHVYFDGRHWDNIILAVHRADFVGWVAERSRRRAEANAATDLVGGPK
jgi:RimJ/RimL family protein N-acetyltransferase